MVGRASIIQAPWLRGGGFKRCLGKGWEDRIIPKTLAHSSPLFLSHPRPRAHCVPDVKMLPCSMSCLCEAAAGYQRDKEKRGLVAYSLFWGLT